MTALAASPDGMTSVDLAGALGLGPGQQALTRIGGALRKAAGRGWAERAGTTAGSWQKPPRAVYRVTAAGREALQPRPPAPGARRRGLHPWDAEALERSKAGESLAALGAAYGVTGATVKRAIGRQGGRAAYPRTGWRDAYLAELRRSGSYGKAAARVGVSYVTAIRHRDSDAAFALAAERARAAGGGSPAGERAAARARAARRRGVARGRILGGLRDGTDFKAAALAAGVPLATAKHWRRSDPAWDRRVVAAAAAGGTTLAPWHRECPGARCGTPTGYDWGCREQSCTAAKSGQVMAARARRQAQKPEGYEVTVRPFTA